jgi:hypothetical protein
MKFAQLIQKPIVTADIGDVMFLIVFAFIIYWVVKQL